jgi:hypothetical protein
MFFKNNFSTNKISIHLPQARAKPDPEARATLERRIRTEFQRNASIPRRQLQRIEYHLTYGRRSLTYLENPSQGGISVLGAAAPEK